MLPRSGIRMLMRSPTTIVEETHVYDVRKSADESPIPRKGKFLSAGIISRWKRALKVQGDEAFPGTGHLGDRDEEVRRLRRELVRVSQERDILKKAAAFFANESR